MDPLPSACKMKPSWLWGGGGGGQLGFHVLQSIFVVTFSQSMMSMHIAVFDIKVTQQQRDLPFASRDCEPVFVGCKESRLQHANRSVALITHSQTVKQGIQHRQLTTISAWRVLGSDL